MKRSFVAAAVLTLTLGMACFTGCKKPQPEPDKTPDEGLYLGIVGFNEHLNTLPMSLLNQNTKFNFETFVDGLSMEDGTILYHAVNTAIDNLSKAAVPEDLINVSVVTFTDGLDQGSYLMSNYSSGAEYLNAVNRRISNEKIGGLNIAAYSIGVHGSDVTDMETFSTNLEKLSSDPEHNVFEVTSMSEASPHFAEIAKQLYNQSTYNNVTLKIPAQEPGDFVRFTFDDVTNAELSTCYIQGIYARVNGNSLGVLNNVEYHGLECLNGSTVSATSQGIFDSFAFRDLIMTNGEPVSMEHVKQWKKTGPNGTWQNNSEFTPTNNSEVVEEYRSALIMLVLDCSKSLSSDFVNMKSAANQFVETLSGNYTVRH